MAIKLNSPAWTRLSASRGASAAAAIDGLPHEFMPDNATSEELVATPQPAARGAGAPGALDISVTVAPRETVVLAVRHPSGALTFHAPRVTTSRSGGGPGDARFIVPISSAPDNEPGTSRGIVSNAFKAIVVKIAGAAADAAVSYLLPKLARSFETSSWKRRGLQERWLKVTQADLSKARLKAAIPSSTDRSLLLLHGTFSDAASAYRSLADSNFFHDVKPLYGDRIFAFDHFTLSRTPEENVRMMLNDLPANKTFQFDVITHSRGGLVLRNLVERSSEFGSLADRFTLGHAVLVAAPNEGTPLATPSRWENTVGWVANLLELFPDNPFTTGAEFVANGLVWIARHASGDLPGLHAMDRDGELVRTLQSPPGPPADRYSALVANYHPNDSVFKRLVDIGMDQFFASANDLVVPSEGGWRVDPSGGSFIRGARIGCFGVGGNIARTDVTHVNFFAQPETVAFLTATLHGASHKLPAFDPALELPHRRLIRSGGAPGVSAPAAAASGRTAPALRARVHGHPTPSTLSPPVDRVTLTVVNGDLTFEERPLLVGHYRAMRLTGTERVIDNLVGHAMSNSLNRGTYPDEPGTNRIFINQRVQPGKFWRTPRPEAVIVAGLGQEGKLRAADLVHSVRQASVAWAEHVAARRPRPKTLSLATTLLASGGTGVTPGQAAQLIVQGVYEANELIRKSGSEERLPEVREVRFIELYLNRASEAWEALKMLAHISPAKYTVVEPIAAGLGSLRRPLDSGYRGADYDFITAETRQDADGNAYVAYALDTKRARTEIRAQMMQGRLLRNLIETASSEAPNDEQISRTLYNLLVPIELEAFLASAGETQIEVDAGTAGIPWELLNDTALASAPREPWAIRSKLLRKFQTENFRAQVNDADSEASILVIAEPQCPPDYPPLPGALAEAKAVVSLVKSDARFSATGVTALFAGGDIQDQPSSRQVIDALFERSWRIVHVAAHGDPVTDKGRQGGVVLSDNTFLGANEIKAMRIVPELVFVNCCHLATGPRSVLREPRQGVHNRAAFASSVAQALIEVGVRCVVAAGWAVNDQAASAFATAFYDALLRGQRFIDAVAIARRKAFEYDGNTWAAYQCYGDPDWQWKLPAGGAGAVPSVASPDEFDDIGSVPALRFALETLTVETTFQGRDPATQLTRVKSLEERRTKMGWRAADVAEPFARAFAAGGDFRSAVRWYEAAIADGQGNVSLKIVEQASNLRVRLAVESIQEAVSLLDRAMEAEQGEPQTAEGRRRGRRTTGPQLDAMKKRVRNARQEARETIDREMALLEQLSGFEKTVERESACGSAMKRLAWLERDAGDSKAASRAIEVMVSHYQRAFDLAVERGADNIHYPAINLIAAEVALRQHQPPTRRKPVSSALFERARASVRAKNKNDADFWSLSAEAELLMYEALAERKISQREPTILRAFRDVHRRSQAASEWRSVADTIRFAIESYNPRASAKEKRAASRLLEEIVSYGNVDAAKS